MTGPSAETSRGGRTFRWLVFLFLLAAAGFLAAAVAARYGALRELLESVTAYPWRVSALLLATAAAASSAALMLTGAAWARFFRAGGGRIGYSAGTFAWLATNLGRYIPGKLWQVTGLAVYAKRRGDSGALAVATSVATQGVTLLSGAALAAALLGADFLASGAAPWRAALLVVALALLLHPGVVRRFTRRLARWMGEPLEASRLGGGEMAWLGAAVTAAWVLHGLAFWLFLRGTVGTDAPSPATATGVFAAAYLAGFAVFLAPAGLVAREGAMAALLAALSPLGAPVAAVAAVGARLWVTVAELAALGAAWVWARSGGSRASAAGTAGAPEGGEPDGGGPKGGEREEAAS